MITTLEGMPRSLKFLLQFTLLVCAVFWFVSQPDSRAQDFPRVCHEPDNIMRNCQFDGGLDGWAPFLLTGSADINVQHGGGECHAPLCPAVHVVTHDHFIGGIYQQVAATPGVNYYANVLWLVFDSLVNDASIHRVTGGIDRRIGIDPFGGTDPNSSNIVWSPENRGNSCKNCLVEQVTASAQSETITIFVKIDDQWRLRAAEQGHGVPPSKDQFWIDDVGIMPVGGEPIADQAGTEEPPTDTPASPTDTPVPPTETPSPAEPPPAPESDVAVQSVVVEESEAEPTLAEMTEAQTIVEPTSSPSVVVEPTTEAVAAAPTNTPIPPPPTLTPTNTPPPTDTPAPLPTRRPHPPLERSSVAPVAESSLPLSLGVLSTVGCVSGFGFIMIGVVLAGLVWLYRIGWGRNDES